MLANFRLEFAYIRPVNRWRDRSARLSLHREDRRHDNEQDLIRGSLTDGESGDLFVAELALLAYLCFSVKRGVAIDGHVIPIFKVAVRPVDANSADAAVGANPSQHP